MWPLPPISEPDQFKSNQGGMGTQDTPVLEGHNAAPKYRDNFLGSTLFGTPHLCPMFWDTIRFYLVSGKHWTPL